MREFFHGWRRKVGCVALVMALALTGMWIRSRGVMDNFGFITGTHWHSGTSLDGNLTWCTIDLRQVCGTALGMDRRPYWTSKSLDPDGIALMRAFSPPFISYWCLVMPLTLLSAYLFSGSRANERERNMREFFRGRRRKAGCVTLVLACVLMCSWVRSAVTIDVIRLSRQEAIISGDGHFVIYLVRRNASPMEWYQWHMRNDERFGPWEKVSRGTFGGIEFGTDVIVDKSTQIEMDRANWWRVPYWELILPLTLLSAYLILSKPRKKPKPRSVTNA